ncbi:MAG: acyl carrier protein [bacterium]|nr:acyl carrier protein [bacterium]
MPAEELRDVEKLNAIAGIDSLAALDFVAALEKEFGLEMEPERLNLEFLADLPSLTEYIVSRSQASD